MGELRSKCPCLISICYRRFMTILFYRREDHLRGGISHFVNFVSFLPLYISFCSDTLSRPSPSQLKVTAPVFPPGKVVENVRFIEQIGLQDMHKTEQEPPNTVTCLTAADLCFRAGGRLEE